MRRSQARPVERSTGPVTPSARQPWTSSTATSCIRAFQIGLPVSILSMPSNRPGMTWSISRIFSTVPGGRSWATPPGRTYAWFIRSPVIASRMSRIISRSRKPLVIAVNAPSSMPPVASATRWLLIRLSSMTSTRITFARSGTSMPSSFSTARQYAVSLKIGDR